MARSNAIIKDIYLYRLQATKARHFLRVARSYIAKDLIAAHTNAIVNGQVVSVIKGTNAGALRSKMYDIPRKIQKQVQPVTKEFAQKIFAESQRRVPIDKKYIGKFNPADPNGFDKDSYTIVRGKYKVKGSNKYKLPIYNEEFLSTKSSMSAARESALRNDRYTKLSLPSGVYAGEQKHFIDRFYRTTTNEKRDLLFVNSNTGMIEEYSIRRGTGKKYPFGPKDLKPLKIGTTSTQKTGGNQELKRSGMVEEGSYGMFKYGYTISYDPTRLDTKFNYAQLQHDRLSYKHTVGESLFLYNAFEKYRDEYYNKVRKATGYVVKEFNNGR